MPGFVIETDLSAEAALALAADAARPMGFAITRLDARSLRLQRGSLWWSLVAGPFTRYYRFRVTVLQEQEDCRRLVLERNRPWWSGYTGLEASRRVAVELANRIDAALREAGSRQLRAWQFP